jgi:hypothetical protein
LAANGEAIMAKRLARYFHRFDLPATLRGEQRTAYFDYADEGDPGCRVIVVQGKPGRWEEHHYQVDCEDDGSAIYFAKQLPEVGVDESLTQLGADEYRSDDSEVYAVTEMSSIGRCTCPGNTAGGSQCKHILIAREMLTRGIFGRVELHRTVETAKATRRLLSSWLRNHTPVDATGTA